MVTYMKGDGPTMFMRPRSHDVRALLSCGLVAMIGACDPLSDTGGTTDDVRPRAAQHIPCGYAYTNATLDGVPTALYQTNARTTLSGAVGSVALAPGCSVSMYGLGGELLLRGEEARATYDDLSTTAAEYTCSCTNAAATPVAEAARQSSRLPLWEGVSVDLKDIPGGWLRGVDTVYFPNGAGSVMASLGQDRHGNDQTAFIISEQGRDGAVDLATDYSTGFCTAAECTCTPTDDLSCNNSQDISSSVETLTAFRRS